MDGIFGVALGIVLIPFAKTIFTPLWNAVTSIGKSKAQPET